MVDYSSWRMFLKYSVALFQKIIFIRYFGTTLVHIHKIVLHVFLTNFGIK